jgi:HsdM N-terminal domain
MTLRKSDLYGSLWKSCDELRGGMDASQYKDYILTLLFVKYVSDKREADPDSLIDVPPGGSFNPIERCRKRSETCLVAMQKVVGSNPVRPGACRCG